MWIFLYVLAPQVLTYLKIPILIDKNNTISSPHGFRGRPESVAVYSQDAYKAEGSTSLICFHYITGGAGNSCFFMLGVPNARKGKTKKKPKKVYSELCSNIQVTTLLLFSPTPKTTHLHLHLQAWMPACQHRGGYWSHHSSGYLSKQNVLKETPRTQWCNPTPCHRAWPHWAAHRLWKEELFFLSGKWPMGFTGRSS